MSKIAFLSAPHRIKRDEENQTMKKKVRKQVKMKM